MSKTRSALVLLLVASLAVSACGGDDSDRDDAVEPTSSTTSAESDGGKGRSLDAGTLSEPPQASGSVVTAEQADAVSRSVLVAWMRGDRTTADKFASDSETLDELFTSPALSQEFSDDGEGYCAEDSSSGSFTGCSYSLVDESPDGILAVSTELEVANGLVLVRGAGAADWND